MNEMNIHVDEALDDGAAAIACVEVSREASLCLREFSAGPPDAARARHVASPEAEDPTKGSEAIANDLLDALLLVAPGLRPLEDWRLAFMVEALENAQTLGDLLELFEDCARGDAAPRER